MKKIVSVLLLSIPVIAAASNCDEISNNIAEKIKNNGVPPSQFQLKLVPTSEAQQLIEGKIVGSCDGGQQKIVYTRFEGMSAPTQVVEPKVQPDAEATFPQTETVKPAEEPNVSTPKQETQAPAVESNKQPEVDSTSPQTESVEPVVEPKFFEQKQETQVPATESNANPDVESAPTQNQEESSTK